MGQAISINKHSTPLQDWLQIQQKLSDIQLNNIQPSSAHISIWKITHAQQHAQMYVQNQYQQANNNNSNIHNNNSNINNEYETGIQDSRTKSKSKSRTKVNNNNSNSNKLLTTVPINLQNINTMTISQIQNIVSSDSCYVVGLVLGNHNNNNNNKNNKIRNNLLKNIDPDRININKNISSLFDNFVTSCQKKSLQISISKGVVNEPQQLNAKKWSYYTYAFLGKRSPQNMKISALSYCYKLSSLLNNYRNLTIITCGGVYRNKKLQLGSVVPVYFSQSNNNKGGKQENSKNLEQFRNIGLVNELILNAVSSININEENNHPLNSNFSLFQYKPKIKIPYYSSDSNPQKQRPTNSQKDSYMSQSNISNQSQSQSQSQSQTQSEAYNSASFSNNFPNNNSYLNPALTQNSNTGSNFKPAQVPIHIPPLKPPMLKLALKPYEDVTYQQMDLQQKNQKYQIRATARHQLKMQKFSNDCSMIIQGLYLSGQKIAKDQQILKKYKITQIVNCAGDYCLNWFQSSQTIKYNYLTFFLKDSQNQNIQCLFYRVIDFINDALAEGKNVLVHCIQGISRSVTFVLAYLIYMNGFDYKQAQAYVKQRRAIASPNNGFMVELIQFYKRLHQHNYHSLGMNPRVFLVSYHCQQTPQIVTARLIKQKLYEGEGRKYLGLDQRGIYIVHAEQVVYIWVGYKCEDSKKMKKFWTYAQQYIKKLQEHQRAPLKMKAIYQGHQGQDFLSLWSLQQIPIDYQNREYDRLFTQQKPNPKPGYLRKHYERCEQQQEQEQQKGKVKEQQYIAKLFIYPDYQNGLGVYELQDLTGLCLLVKSDAQKIKIFIWRSEDWMDDNNSSENNSNSKSSNQDKNQQINQYLQNVIKTHYSSYPDDSIQIVQEQNGSDQFINCFG